MIFKFFIFETSSKLSLVILNKVQVSSLCLFKSSNQGTIERNKLPKGTYFLQSFHWNSFGGSSIFSKLLIFVCNCSILFCIISLCAKILSGKFQLQGHSKVLSDSYNANSSIFFSLAILSNNQSVSPGEKTKTIIFVSKVPIWRLPKVIILAFDCNIFLFIINKWVLMNTY